MPLHSPDDPILVIDIGGTNIRLGSVSRAGAMTRGGVGSTDRLREADPVEVLAALVRAHATAMPRPPAGIVVGVPGFLDATRRVVMSTPNIAALSGVPLADRLAAACGLPVWLEHDATLLVRGEHAAGAAAGAGSVLGVYFGTGIGAGFLAGGRRLPVRTYAMQLGHIAARGDGRRCSCGGIDCIEAYASGLVLQAIARDAGLAIEQVFAGRASDDRLDRALARFVDDQAVALATAITLLDPEVAVIGGGVVEMPAYPFTELTAAVRRRLSPVRDPDRVALVAASLGWPAVLHGALPVVAGG
jgi:allose kinase